MGVETREAKQESARFQSQMFRRLRLPTRLRRRRRKDGVTSYRLTLRNSGTRQVAQDATPQEQWGERTVRSAVPESTKQSMKKKPSQKAKED